MPADAYVPIDAPENDGAGLGGGLLTSLSFAVVGDTRPLNPDDTTNYPTAIITKIWQDVAAFSPLPQFAISTGDYMDATTDNDEQYPQLTLYQGARASYGGFVYPAMGNHECNGLTTSNCGPNGSDGESANYRAFMSVMLMPLGVDAPYYVERFAARDGGWTAKVVVIAANAWSDEQATWLNNVLGEPTTYTFVVRHEEVIVIHAPGVVPSQEILDRNAITLLVVGHAHTYRHDPMYKQVVIGNGGAPLSGSVDHGYAVIERNDDATVTLTMYDYLSNAVIDTFTINADGSPH